MSVQSPPWPPPIETCQTKLISNVSFFRSPATGSIQRSVRSGSHWEFAVKMVALDDLRRKNWTAFLAKIQDEASTFYWSTYPLGRPYNYPTVVQDDRPWGATPLINGANQTGRLIAVDGLIAAAAFKQGDFISFDNPTYRELHQITADATANGSGQVTFSIVPEIRVSPADNAVVQFDGNHSAGVGRCACEVMLLTNDQAKWNYSGWQADFDIILREALSA